MSEAKPNKFDYVDWGDCVQIICTCGHELWPSYDDEPTQVCGNCGRVYRIERTLHITVQEPEAAK